MIINAELKENNITELTNNFSELTNMGDKYSDKNIFNNIHKIIFYLINEINTEIILKGNDITIPYENIIISMTSTENQKKSENKNQTSINLKECEDKLKLYYNISEKNPLYIMLFESKEEGMKIPKIEYNVYFPLYNKGLSQLN